MILIRKELAVVIILLFVGSNCLAVISSIAQDIEKQSSEGNWLYVGGSGPGNYTRIQDAIDNAIDGDTVFVYDDSSPYLESVKINKSISLNGENPETTVISGNESYDTIDFQRNNINLTGFTLKNGHYAIINSVVNISNCTVFNNIFDGNYAGVWFEYIFNLTITENYFFENHFALAIRNSHNVIVSLNTIKLNVEGICVDGSENVTISLNTIEENSDLGISIYRYPLHTFIPDNYQVFSNIIKNNYEAIYNDQESGIFRDNVIESNHVGINFQYSSKTVISKNLIKNNSVGVTIHDGSHNEIIMNNFLQNERDAAFFYHLKIGFRRPQNVFRQNYWDTNTSLGPKSIKGQLEFNIGFYHSILIRIPWFCFDWFPAKEPYDIPGIS
jgi:parallel beta-helix repeat protein